MIACDTNQLHRIECSIAALECRSPAEQLRLKCMLEALRREQREVMGEDISANTSAFPLETAVALGRLR